MTFNVAMPEPGEVIRIVARTWGCAHVAFTQMQNDGCTAKTFHYIMLRQQVQGLRGGRLFALVGWSDLLEAQAIEQECKLRGIEIVNYHYERG